MAQIAEVQIGEIAKLAEVSVDTVRYYERLKLLPRAARTNSGYRVFPVETVERIKFIKQAQEMGLTLEEIKQLFASGGDANQCRRVSELLSEKIVHLDSKIKQMKSFKELLALHLTACEMELKKHGKEAECPVLVTIENIK
ncbi:MAG: heavy metal-responsive transcriptional regulator [Pyrinomonadaceae bacterium]